MHKKTYRGFKIGDRVSVKMSELSYDSAPPVTPSMVGTIKDFPPKVLKTKGPLFDRGDYFAYIIFDDTYADGGNHIHNIRSGIDICNLQKN